MTENSFGPAEAGAATVVSNRRERFAKLGVALMRVPLFAYVLLGYIVIEMLVFDVRAVFLSIGAYHLTWVEIMYLTATVVAMGELVRVSKPGIDNTREAIAMLFIGVVYLVLFVLGTASVQGFALFNNTEFLMIMLVSWTQVLLAFIINARTLKRTIDYTGGEHY